MKSIRNNKGFTLIELMIVVVIIGILAALAIPKFSQVSKTAKKAEADGPLGQICTLAGVYQEKHSANAADLAALKEVGWAGPGGQHFLDASYTYTKGTEPAIGKASVKGETSVDGVTKTLDCDNRALGIVES
jgi:prepilin-type N-terminal cleavage/methylation domain-containing protein